MGYAVLVPTADRARLIACGVVPMLEAPDASRRLLAIAEALDALIERHRPGALAVERLYFNKNVRTAMRVAEARGIALLCAARARLEVAEYTPQEVKLSVAGAGDADKTAVQRMLPHLVALAEPVRQDNVADAVAIALTHAHRGRYASTLAALSAG